MRMRIKMSLTEQDMNLLIESVMFSDIAGRYSAIGKDIKDMVDGVLRKEEFVVRTRANLKAVEGVKKRICFIGKGECSLL